MNFTALNNSQNITLPAAREFVRKLRALGFRVGDIHANAQASAGEANIVNVAELELAEDGKYDLVVYAARDWHNLALLKLMFGAGTVTDFEEVSHEIGGGSVLDIPGAVKAVEKLIEKA